MEISTSTPYDSTTGPFNGSSGYVNQEGAWTSVDGASTDYSYNFTANQVFEVTVDITRGSRSSSPAAIILGDTTSGYAIQVENGSLSTTLVSLGQYISGSFYGVGSSITGFPNDTNVHTYHLVIVVAGNGASKNVFYGAVDGFAPNSHTESTPGIDLTVGSWPITVLTSGAAGTVAQLISKATSPGVPGVAYGGAAAPLTFLSPHLTGGSYNGSVPITIATDATSANVAATIVERDGFGNFSAGTITASLSGNATRATNATDATNSANEAITDDTSTNATMYITWVGANSGNNPLKTSSSKLTYNPSTGAFSTTSLILAGALNGATTGAFSGAVSAASASLSAATPLTLTGTGTSTVMVGTTGSSTGLIINNSGGTSGDLAHLQLNASNKIIFTNAGGIRANDKLSAGDATAATLSAGDVGASRGTSSGELVLGGSTAHASIDYGVTAAAKLTFTNGSIVRSLGTIAGVLDSLGNIQNVEFNPKTDGTGGLLNGSGLFTNIDAQQSTTRWEFVAGQTLVVSADIAGGGGTSPGDGLMVGTGLTGTGYLIYNDNAGGIFLERRVNGTRTFLASIGSNHIDTTAHTVALCVKTNANTAPTIVTQGSTQLTSSNTTCTVTLGWTPAIGNLLVCAVDCLLGSATAMSAASGWTLLDQGTGTSGTNDLLTLYRIVQGGDTATIAPATNGTATKWTVTAYEVTGFDRVSVTSQHSVAMGTATNPPAVTATAVIPSVTSSLALAFIRSTNTVTAPAAPSGWTLDATFNETTIGTTQVSCYHQAAPATGSALTPTFTWGSGTSAVSSAAIVVILAQGNNTLEGSIDGQYLGPITDHGFSLIGSMTWPLTPYTSGSSATLTHLYTNAALGLYGGLAQAVQDVVTQTPAGRGILNLNPSGGTTIGLDDITTNGQYYPLFASQTGGEVLIKTSSSKLQYVPSTGTLTTTALALSGATPIALTGTATSTVTVGTTGSSTALILNNSGGTSGDLVHFQLSGTDACSITNAGGIKANGRLSAGNATAAALVTGDVGASRGVSSGKLWLGGSSTSATLDWGVTTSGKLTFSVPPVMSGANIASATIPVVALAYDTSVKDCTTNLLPDADFGDGTGTGTTGNNAIDGTYSTGTAPKFWNPRNTLNIPNGGVQAAFSQDDASIPPVGHGWKIALAAGLPSNGTVGLNTGATAVDGFGPVELKIGVPYVFSYYAKADDSTVNFTLGNSASGTYTAKTGFATNYADTAWHRYVFDIPAGAADAAADLRIRISGAIGGAIVRPTGLSAAVVAGGALTAGAYRWEVTAVNANGETVGSNEVTATTSGSNLTVNLSWTAVTGGVTYNVYRTAAGGASGTELKRASGIVGTTYSDTAVGSPSGSLPTFNTTGTAANLWICGPKLEEGSALSDWSPSPYQENVAATALNDGTNVRTASAVGAALDATGQLKSTDDTSTNATYYPIMATATSASPIKTSSTKLTYNPSTGLLNATRIQAASDGTHSSYVPPAYKKDGSAVTNTFHIVEDTVTAAGASTTVTFSVGGNPTAANFASATYFLSVFDETALAAATITSKASASFAFTSVNTHVYSYFAAGI